MIILFMYFGSDGRMMGHITNQQTNRWTDGDNVNLSNMIFSQKTKKGLTYKNTFVLIYLYYVLKIKKWFD